MITRSEVYNNLVKQLESTSPKWSGLQNGIVGKELLALGTEIIYQAEMCKDSFATAFDYTRCSYAELCRIGAMENICVSKCAPSQVTVHLPDDASTNVFLPFNLSVTSGAVHFVNCKTAKGGSDCVMSAGTVKRISTGSQGYTSGIPYADTNENPVITTVVEDPVTLDRYIALTPNTIADSVYVYSYGRLLQRCDFVTEYDTEQPGYKLLTNSDGQICVHLGDGKFAKETELEGLEIFYLEALTDAAAFDEAIAVGIEGGGTLYSKVVEYVQGEYSLAAARANYIKAYAGNRILNNAKLVKEFMQAYMEVFDCRVIKSEEDGRYYCKVVVKPQDQGAADSEQPPTWEDILIDLSAYGDMFTNYSIKRGRPIKFKCQILDAPDDEKYGLAREVLTQALDYHNIGIDYMINTVALQADIYNKTTAPCTVRLHIEEIVADTADNGKLAFYPVPETIYVRGYDPNCNITDPATGGKGVNVIKARDFGSKLIGKDFNYNVLSPYFQWGTSPVGYFGFFTSAVPLVQDARMYYGGISDNTGSLQVEVQNTAILGTTVRTIYQSGIATHCDWDSDDNHEYRYLCDYEYMSAQELNEQKLKEAFRSMSDRARGTVWNFKHLVCCSSDYYVVLAATDADLSQGYPANVTFRLAAFPASDFKKFPEVGLDILHPVAVAESTDISLFKWVFECVECDYTSIDVGDKAPTVAPYAIAYGGSPYQSWDKVIPGMKVQHGPSVIFTGKYFFAVTKQAITRYTVGGNVCNFSTDRSKTNGGLVSTDFYFGNLVESGSSVVDGVSAICGLTSRGDDIFFAYTNFAGKVVMTCYKDSIVTTQPATIVADCIKLGETGPHWSTPGLPEVATTVHFISSPGECCAFVNTKEMKVVVWDKLYRDMGTPTQNRAVDLSYMYDGRKHAEFVLPVTMTDDMLIAESLEDFAQASKTSIDRKIVFTLPYACNHRMFLCKLREQDGTRVDTITYETYVTGGLYTTETYNSGEIISTVQYGQIRELGSVDYATRDIQFLLSISDDDHIHYQAVASGKLDDDSYLYHDGFVN